MVLFHAHAGILKRLNNNNNCGGVPRPNQQGCSSVLERVGQAIGGRRLEETTRDVRASSFLFQRISVVVLQRFNSVLLHDGFVDDDRPE